MTSTRRPDHSDDGPAQRRYRHRGGDKWDPDFLTNAQRTQVEQALRESGGNKAAAARLLGISRRSMFRWLKRLDLSQPPVSKH